MYIICYIVQMEIYTSSVTYQLLGEVVLWIRGRPVTKCDPFTLLGDFTWLQSRPMGDPAD